MEDELRGDEPRDDEPGFPVVCVWCGALIRRASAPVAPGMCRVCFQHMVEEHTRLAARQRASAYASDR